MAGYKPHKITGMQTGLVQQREDFLLPDDAYPVLRNAYVWREQLKRKLGTKKMGRLRRVFTATSIGNSGASPWSFNLFTLASITETNAQVEVGSVTISIGGTDFVDDGYGNLLNDATNYGTVNYDTGAIVITTTIASGTASTATFNYFPGLPCMGIRLRERNNINQEDTIFFDTTYAYQYNGTSFQELDSTTPTTWTGSNSNFFWSTNFWVNASNAKLFWVTNNNINVGAGTSDPIHYYDGTTWTAFTPNLDTTGTPQVLQQALLLLPFRGRMLAFNTYEGTSIASSVHYAQRIRWAAIGTPIAANSWYDDTPGKGGFLDIPTSQSITAVGFVRDNLVIYCERSTWQLRFTGNQISPFIIEKINSELGAESSFSAVQFDTSLVGVGDKGIVECDSFSSKRIDIKIPNFVFDFNNTNNGVKRVQGVRDFINRLVYWTVPTESEGQKDVIYPNQRLVYNYENDSWAIFDDNFTAMGTYYPTTRLTWGTHITWADAHFKWYQPNSYNPEIVAGDHQGFISYPDALSKNQESLYITDITGNATTATTITSPSHNLQTGQVISISNIPASTPFANSLNNPKLGLITGATQANPCEITSASHGLSTGDEVQIYDVGGMTELNGFVFTITVTGTNTFTLDGIDSTSYTAYTSGGTWSSTSSNKFMIIRQDADTFDLYKYNSETGTFITPQLNAAATYIGGGEIALMDNMTIQSKKFNFIDQGQNIQLGFVDILAEAAADAKMSLYVYIDYNNDSPINAPFAIDDTFFNSVVPLAPTDGIQGSKYFQRVFCASRGNFITLVYTFSNEQMSNKTSEHYVQIDAQILWLRTAGKQLVRI